MINSLKYSIYKQNLLRYIQVYNIYTKPLAFVNLPHHQTGNPIFLFYGE